MNHQVRGLTIEFNQFSNSNSVSQITFLLAGLYLKIDFLFYALYCEEFRIRTSHEISRVNNNFCFVGILRFSSNKKNNQR
jgi:hypothetical protein